MVRLVPGPQRLQHLHGSLHVRLLDEHGLEAALQGSILLDVPAVLPLGGCAQDLYLTAGEGRLHHVACVDSALRRSRPDDRVKLVDEGDDLAVRLCDLVEDGLEALLELPAELAPGNHAGDVQRHQAAPLQLLRHVAGSYALGEPLGDGCLAHSGPADEHGVVLGAPDQRLHRPGYLDVPADHRVQLAVARKLRQVDAEPLQRLVAGLGPGVRDPV